MMKMFELMENKGALQVTACYDRETNLRAFIAIHSTAMGTPVLGGCRMWKYPSEEAALNDALALAMDMTYRTAISGCDLSGGSVVIMGNPRTDKSEALFRALGRFIDALEGRFVLTDEMGTSNADLVNVRRETPYVVILPEIGTMDGIEAPSAAWGVYYGLMACVKEVFKVSSLKGLHLAVQGVGHVGSSLIAIMKKREPEVKLSICDVDYDKMKKVQDEHPEVQIVSPEDLLSKECDVLVPCAVGGILTPEVVRDLRCRIIAGGAACMLSEEKAALMINEKGILLAPDFVINAGGIIQAEEEIRENGAVMTEESFGRIAHILSDVLGQAKEEKRSPYRVAMRMAEERIARIRHISGILR
jgi:leucine dehydrogenase